MTNIIDYPHPHPLFVELQNYEKQGVTIWLDGNLSSAEDTAALVVREENCYMRDYVPDEQANCEKIKQVHFNKIME